MTSNKNRLKIIYDSILQSEQRGLLEVRGDILSGFSGKKLVGTLQRLSKLLLNEKSCYLEVGVYQGLTLLSSALVSQSNSFYGIDNFQFFDSKGQNKNIINERMKILEINNTTLIDNDYEDALENLSFYLDSKKVSVYFVDGPHDYRSQFMCLQLIKPHLTEEAIIIIDDSNYRHVRQANRDFLITNPEFKLIFEAYTKAHPINWTEDEKYEPVNGWWNGINIIYKDTNNLLDAVYPETLRDRTLFENEHIYHSAKYPEHILSFHNFAKAFRFYNVYNIFKRAKPIYSGEFKSTNTYSTNLPKSQFNPSIKRYI